MKKNSKRNSGLSEKVLKLGELAQSRWSARRGKKKHWPWADLWFSWAFEYCQACDSPDDCSYNFEGIYCFAIIYFHRPRLVTNDTVRRAKANLKVALAPQLLRLSKSICKNKTLAADSPWCHFAMLLHHEGFIAVLLANALRPCSPGIAQCSMARVPVIYRRGTGARKLWRRRHARTCAQVLQPLKVL